jgi:hypothetical protein
LLVLGQDSVEIAHDALLQAWKQLRDWLADDQLGRALYSQVVTDAAAWDNNGRDPAYLYRPGRLATIDAAAARWRDGPARYPPPLPATSQAFLSAAHHAARRAARWRRSVLAGLLALTVIAVSAAWIAVHNAANADRQAANAARQHAIALSRQLAAESLTAEPTDPLTARPLASAAWRVFPTDQAGSVLARLLIEQQQGGILPGDAADSGALAVAFSSDGKLLAAGYGDGYVRLWDPVAGQGVGFPLPADPGPAAGVSGMAFSLDGKLLATADDDGYVRLWNPATGQAVGAPLLADHGTVAGGDAVAFSPDGKLLAASGDGTVRLWNPATGQPVGIPPPADPRDGVVDVAFSPGGKLLASAASTAPCGCGTRSRAGPSALPFRLPPAAACSRWRSARTASSWPLDTAMGLCGYGTRPPCWPSALPSRPVPAREGACSAWRSARTANSWPAPTPTVPCGRGKFRFSPTRTRHCAPTQGRQQRQNGRNTPLVKHSPASADDMSPPATAGLSLAAGNVEADTPDGRPPDPGRCRPPGTNKRPRVRGGRRSWAIVRDRGRPDRNRARC